MSGPVPRGVGVLTLLLALPRSHLLDLQPPQGPRAPHHALVVVGHPVVPAHRLPFRGAVFGPGEQLGSPAAGVHPAHAVHVVEDALAGVCTERRRRRRRSGTLESCPRRCFQKAPPAPTHPWVSTLGFRVPVSPPGPPSGGARVAPSCSLGTRTLPEVTTEGMSCLIFECFQHFNPVL